jgi:hypothetical protein
MIEDLRKGIYSCLITDLSIKAIVANFDSTEIRLKYLIEAYQNEGTIFTKEEVELLQKFVVTEEDKQLLSNIKTFKDEQTRKRN